MALVSLEGIEHGWGERMLLRGVSLVVNDDDRIGLVGPNGSGKSTLMQIAAGLVVPDAGKVTRRRDASIGYLEQEPVLPPAATLRDAVRAGIPERAVVLAELDRVHHALEVGEDDAQVLLRRQGALETRLAALGGHAIEHRIEALLEGLGLPEPDRTCGTLSGGEARRVALARLLLADPDLMLLDEPTNHLDALAVDWLEDFLLQTGKPLLMVTHDRYFLDRVVDRIVELDRGALHAYEGGYGEFLIRRSARLSSEARSEETRLNLLRRETKWMRRGPPARSTKAKARIQRFHQLVDAQPEASDHELDFTIPAGPRLGTKIVTLRGVTKTYGEKTVLRAVDLDLHPGDRVGIVGPNGAGKTTLVDLCRGLREPDAGAVEIGSTVRFAAIDQQRSDLDGNRSVVREVGDGNVWVQVGGRDIRVEGFLERMLFPRELFETPVRELSGGERNRILLAKLLLQGGNVLVLDEPTNDLDLMTLRVLEEALIAFPGVVIAVSHDRYFLDRVATRVLHVDGKGNVRHHAGDASDLIERIKRETKAAAAADRSERAAPRSRPAPTTRKLTWKESRELEALPDRIHAAEERLADLDKRLADPGLYSGPEARIRELTALRKELAAEVEALYERWSALE